MPQMAGNIIPEKFGLTISDIFPYIVSVEASTERFETLFLTNIHIIDL
jgi:hypothetical protein